MPNNGALKPCSNYRVKNLLNYSKYPKKIKNIIDNNVLQKISGQILKFGTGYALIGVMVKTRHYKLTPDKLI